MREETGLFVKYVTCPIAGKRGSLTGILLYFLNPIHIPITSINVLSVLEVRSLALAFSDGKATRQIVYGRHDPRTQLTVFK